MDIKFACGSQNKIFVSIGVISFFVMHVTRFSVLFHFLTSVLKKPAFRNRTKLRIGRQVSFFSVSFPLPRYLRDLRRMHFLFFIPFSKEFTFLCKTLMESRKERRWSTRTGDKSNYFREETLAQSLFKRRYYISLAQWMAERLSLLPSRTVWPTIVLIIVHKHPRNPP